MHLKLASPPDVNGSICASSNFTTMTAIERAQLQSHHAASNPRKSTVQHDRKMEDLWEEAELDNPNPSSYETTQASERDGLDPSDRHGAFRND